MLHTSRTIVLIRFLFRGPSVVLTGQRGRTQTGTGQSLAHSPCLLAISLLATIFACAPPKSRAQENSASPSRNLITSAASIRKMSPQEAARNYPVRLVGIVTYYDPEEPDLFIQDSTFGIWVNIQVDKPSVPLHAGDLVEVEGVTEITDFAPEIGKPRFKLLGHTALPLARRVSYEQMASTQEDSQRVEVEGVVRRVYRKGNVLRLDVALPDGRVDGRFPMYTKTSLPALVDARVRLRGTCGAQFNSRKQLTGVVIYIANESQLQVLEAPP